MKTSSQTLAPLLFTVFTIFSSLTAFAEVPPTEKKEEIVVIEDEKPHKIYKGTSEYNRMDKNYLLTTQLFGWGPITGRGVGLSLGKFNSRNSLIIFELIRNMKESELNAAEKIKNYAAGIHFKKFEGNTFYFRMGGDFRTASYEVTSGASSKSFESESVTFNTSIGNEWFWESFTMGIDWLGVAVPLYTKLKSEAATGIFTLAELEKQKKEYTSDTQGIYTRFYIGAAF